MIQKIYIKIVLIIFPFLICLNSIAYSELWHISSGDYKSSKYSNLDQINNFNVSKLKTAWIYKNGFTTEKKNNLRNNINNQSTPIFTGNSLIVTSLDDYIISLNPKTGEELWRTKIAKSSAKRGLTYFNENLFVPSLKGIFVLEPTTGKINTSFGKNGFIGSELKEISLVPPIVKDNKIIVPFRSSIAAFSLPDGNLLWKTKLNGSRIWSGISYDDRTETIIIVTSNLVNLIGNTNIQDDFSNSIVLFDSNSGEVRCKFKDTIHDHWDLDMVGNPIIVFDELDDKSLNKVYGLSKTGNTFVVDLKNCKLLNENNIEKIQVNNNSPIEGQYYSDYQIKITNPEKLMDLKYDLKNYLNYISSDTENYEYIKHITRNSKFNDEYIPLSFNYDVLMMGLHGGPEWPGGSYDKLNNQIIIPTNHYPWILRTFYTCCNRKEVTNFFYRFNVNLINIKEFSGYNIYKQKCQSCHGKNKNGLYVSEFFGDTYYPSLNGITKINKLESIKKLSKFNESHKYLNNLNIDKDDLADVKNYLESRDKYLFSKNILEKRGAWQLLLDKNKNFASIPPYGKITSLSTSTGLIRWQIPFGYKYDKSGKIIKGDINFGGVLSTGGNLLFATGTTDKKIYAYKSTDGQELWNHTLDYAGSSPPMTFFFEGIQYIIVNSSGGKFFGYEDKLGDVIHAFKLF
tara:strand:- start:442 stop:2490 length:2049 start_codon:yes stop_codon:yes gene_type:complete